MQEQVLTSTTLEAHAAENWMQAMGGPGGGSAATLGTKPISGPPCWPKVYCSSARMRPTTSSTPRRCAMRSTSSCRMRRESSANLIGVYGVFSRTSSTAKTPTIRARPRSGPTTRTFLQLLGQGRWQGDPGGDGRAMLANTNRQSTAAWRTTEYSCSIRSKGLYLLEPHVGRGGGKPVLMTSVTAPLLEEGNLLRHGRVDISLPPCRAWWRRWTRPSYGGQGKCCCSATRTGRRCGGIPGRPGKRLAQSPLAQDLDGWLARGRGHPLEPGRRPVADLRAGQHARHGSRGIYIELPPRRGVASALHTAGAASRPNTAWPPSC